MTGQPLQGRVASLAVQTAAALCRPGGLNRFTLSSWSFQDSLNDRINFRRFVINNLDIIDKHTAALLQLIDAQDVYVQIGKAWRLVDNQDVAPARIYSTILEESKASWSNILDTGHAWRLERFACLTTRATVSHRRMITELWDSSGV